LKLSLAVLAAATLAACGGGDSSDVADVYVGTWKSKCYKGTGSDGNTYYYYNSLAVTKATAAELAFAGTGTAYSDAACTNKLSTFARDAVKINIGAKTTFLGAPADSMVYTVVSTGEARPGFIVADTTKMNVVINNSDGSVATGWGSASPYTKQ
jgi:hypothetical protein